jgi:carboxyl-terminal processing protease
MNRKISLGLTIVLVLLSMLVTFAATFTAMLMHEKPVTEIKDSDSTPSHTHAYANLSFNFEKLALIDELFKDEYIGEIDEETLTDWLLYAYVVGTEDPYAAYYTSEEYAELMQDRRGEMQGIGVNIIYNAEYGCIEVINVMPDSPALEAGILLGDLVVYVGNGDDAVSVAELGYNLAVSKLQGKSGTFAEFVVYRGENYSERLEFSIERGFVTEQTVRWRMYEGDGSIGIIQILSFDAKTPEQFIEAFGELANSGAEKFVLDVRYNPGGNLGAICQILDYLLPEGPIIRIEYKSGQEEMISSDAAAFDVPMVVLANSSTASAGELFCSALQDYNIAKVVGTQTYGKGTMQTTYQLGDGSAVSLSVAYYNPPFSDNYDGVGVTPDIEVDLTDEQKLISIYKIKDSEDPQIQTAIAVLNGSYAEN